MAVVTGAASGIGLALSERLAVEGMHVVMADVEEIALNSAAAALRADGASVLAVPTDVSRADDVEALAKETLSAFGGVHLLCNNAGVSTGVRAAVWEIPLEDWRWIIGVNLFGVIHGVRAFMPALLEQEEAHIVNTASVAGLITGALGAYSVSKHGVVAFSEALQLQLQMRGGAVGVSVLCPGWVRTRIADSDRNRPGGQAEADGDALVVAAEQAMRALIEGGMEPAEVAAEVVEAVRANRFYVLTHPAMAVGVERRMRDILEGRPPTLPSPM